MCPFIICSGNSVGHASGGGSGVFFPTRIESIGGTVKCSFPFCDDEMMKCSFPFCDSEMVKCFFPFCDDEIVKCSVTFCDGEMVKWRNALFHFAMVKWCPKLAEL